MIKPPKSSATHRPERNLMWYKHNMCRTAGVDLHDFLGFRRLSGKP